MNYQYSKVSSFFNREFYPQAVPLPTSGAGAYFALKRKKELIIKRFIAGIKQLLLVLLVLIFFVGSLSVLAWLIS